MDKPQPIVKDTNEYELAVDGDRVHLTLRGVNVQVIATEDGQTEVMLDMPSGLWLFLSLYGRLDVSLAEVPDALIARLAKASLGGNMPSETVLLQTRADHREAISGCEWRMSNNEIEPKPPLISKYQAECDRYFSGD